MTSATDHTSADSLPRSLRHQLLHLLTLVCLTATGSTTVAPLNAAENVDVARVQSAWADSITPLVKAHQGNVSVVVRHIPSGAEFAVNPDEPMPTASLIKFPVMLAAYAQVQQGKLDLNKNVTYGPEDKVPGSGILSRHFSDPVTLSLRNAIRLMIACSDNAATNLVLKELGLTAVNEYAARLECPHTRMYAQVFKPESSIDPEASRKWGLGCTTAREMVSLLQKLEQNAVEAPDYREELLEHLRACEDRARLGKLLPEGTQIALKTGSVTAARTVAGVIVTSRGPLAICVLTAENQDRRWVDDNAAHKLAQEIARSAVAGLERSAAPTPEPPADHQLRLGSRGPLVEDLQRTLQAHLKLNPALTVDGEFGPETQRALRLFQQSGGLPETAETNPATWTALGPLVPPDSVLTAQAAAQVPLLPADPVDGPPITSCKAWVVGQPAGGSLFVSDDADTPLDFASTTKMMTAYVILKRAQEHPELLDGTLTVSSAAAQTPGSSAGIRTGEAYRVSELLSGLMLPSGNDAAVALAEHVGALLLAADQSNEAEGTATSALERFVAEMNRTAAALEMTKSSYRNPHGLTHPEHRSSARDQFRLVSAALTLPRFRELVSQRQAEGLCDGPGGYQRRQVWTNTNWLLNQEGFAGVKTGTTSAAGACLVSLAKRGDQEAVAVVLGAKTSENRYLDTRNLFQWYWRKTAATER